ncbi:hypothetical protein BKA62DRAFT_771679 [Auriculariales sp. MPI-PUGE-AT-0066]|nr:hypothetical protein BKA62DRAFT_771679 [Auriculariales sp. MPI-PUGE-AT-0066]
MALAAESGAADRLQAGKTHTPTRLTPVLLAAVAGCKRSGYLPSSWSDFKFGSSRQSALRHSNSGRSGLGGSKRAALQVIESSEALRGMMDRDTIAAIIAWLENVPKDALLALHGVDIILPAIIAASNCPQAITLELTAPYTLLIVSGASESVSVQLVVAADGLSKGLFGRGVILAALRTLVESDAQTGQLLVRPDYHTNPTLGSNAREILLVYSLPGQPRPTSVRLHAAVYQANEQRRR